MDWILKIKAEANKTLQEIYSLYREDCIAFIKTQYQLDEDVAVEIFQLTVIVFYDNIISGKLVSLDVELKTYLMGIARYKCYELFKKRKKEVKIENNDISLLDLYVLEDGEDEDNSEQIQMLSKSLATLGSPCNEIIQLYYYHKKNMEEITRQLDYKNADTTKNLKYKCLKRLQNIFFSHYKQKTIFNHNIKK